MTSAIDIIFGMFKSDKADETSNPQPNAERPNKKTNASTKMTHTDEKEINPVHTGAQTKREAIMSNIVEITVPAAGESVTEADIGELFVKVGDSVKVDDPVVSLETDKASMDVPAPANGTITEILVDEGDTVNVGDVVIKIDTSGAPAAATPAAPATETQATASDAGAGENIDITVPAAGESVTEADIGELFVKVGDQVKVDDPIVSLETDKASMDVPAPANGTITAINVEEGDTVEVGKVIASMTTGAAPAATASQTPAATTATDAPLSPAPRRVIDENNLDASQIAGSGKGGRITKGDALAALEAGNTKAPAKAAPHTPRELGNREERVKMTRMRQTIARRLKESQDSAAMLTTFNDVDMTAVMEARKQYKDLFAKKHGIKLGFMSFFVKACVQALKEVPEVNAEIDGTDIIYKDHYDIGMAVGLDKGLVVPVIKDCDMLSLAGIEKTIMEKAVRAREGKLGMDEMTGGTFSITNGGVYGSLLSTPILNAPQSGILGLHRIEDRPVVRNGEIVVRPMMYLALSYDHRIVDGKGAVTFLVRVKENLEDPARLLLDL